MKSDRYIFSQEERVYGDTGASKYMFRFVSLAYGVLVLVLLKQLYSVASAMYEYTQSLPGDSIWSIAMSGSVWLSCAPIIDALLLLFVVAGLWISYYLVVLQSGQYDLKRYSANEMMVALGVLIGFYFTISSIENMPAKAALDPDTAWIGLLLLTLALLARLARAMHLTPRAWHLEEAITLQAWTEMLVRMAHGLVLVASTIWLGLRYNRMGLQSLEMPRLVAEAVFVYSLLACFVVVYSGWYRRNDLEWRWAYREEGGAFMAAGVCVIALLLVMWGYSGTIAALTVEYRGFIIPSVGTSFAMMMTMRRGPAIPVALDLDAGGPFRARELPAALCERIQEIVYRIYDERCWALVLHWPDDAPSETITPRRSSDAKITNDLKKSSSAIKDHVSGLVEVEAANDDFDVFVKVGAVGLDCAGFSGFPFWVECKSTHFSDLPPMLLVPIFHADTIVSTGGKVAVNAALVVIGDPDRSHFAYREEVHEMLQGSCQLMAHVFESGGKVL